MEPNAQSLLAHIAPSLSLGPEDLATESLNYVLAYSRVARGAFDRHLGALLGVKLGPLSYRTQAADPDGTRPDLVGMDEDSVPNVYVESKFWAGLTEAQPVGYLDRIRREGGKGLVVLAPNNRLATLWPELLRRCGDAGLQVDPDAGSVRYRANLQSHPPLAITSWATVLEELLAATKSDGDRRAEEDLRQFKGLCDRMETAGFVPLQSEELTGNVAQRIEDYCGLVDDLTVTLEAEGLASIDGLRSVNTRNAYCRYVTLKGNGAQIAFQSSWWATRCQTPLWIALKGPNWQPSATIRDAVRSLLTADPPKAFVDDVGMVLVPLFLPTARERDSVLSSILDQAHALCDMLP